MSIAESAQLAEAAAHQSTYIENVLRHSMLSDVCSTLWCRDPTTPLQVFNSEVDNAGFDLVLKLGTTLRYVQLKQAHDRRMPPHCSVRASFASLAGSCVVLMSYRLEDLRLTGFRFFGRTPDVSMENISAYRNSISPGRRNAEGERHVRSHYHDVKTKDFTGLLTSAQLTALLFPPDAQYVDG